MEIRKLRRDEPLPMNLLLLADPSQAMVEEYVANGQCYVAELDGNLVGVYVLAKLDAKTMEIMNIAVEESMHGRGIGKQLIVDAIQTTKALGYTAIEIGTGNSSVGQLALYQKCGFRIEGVIQDFFVDHYAEPIFENGIQCRDMIRLSMAV